MNIPSVQAPGISCSVSLSSSIEQSIPSEFDAAQLALFDLDSTRQLERRLRDRDYRADGKVLPRR